MTGHPPVWVSREQTTRPKKAEHFEVSPVVLFFFFVLIQPYSGDIAAEESKSIQESLQLHPTERPATATSASLKGCPRSCTMLAHHALSNAEVLGHSGPQL